MRASRALVVLALIAVVGILVAWFAISHTNEERSITAPALAPLTPKTEVHENEARDGTNQAPLATKTENSTRAEALASEPVHRRANSSEGAVLRVHVFDGQDTDAKLEGVTVELFNLFGEAQEVLSAQGNEVTFGGLSPGEYHARASAKDHGSGNRKVELKPGEGSGDIALGLVRTLRLRVRWLAREGTPLVDSLARTRTGTRVELSVFATYRPPNDSEMPWSTNVGSLLCTMKVGDRHLKLTRKRNGFDDIKSQVVEEADGSADGTIGVMSAEATPPFFASAWFGEALVDVQHIEPGAKEVVFTSDPEVLFATRAALKLRVVDGASGGPIAGAKVRVVRGDEGLPAASTDAEGAFVMAGITPGTARVEVSFEGRGHHLEDVFLRAGAVTDLGDVHLEMPMTIRVHTVDESGKAVNVKVNFAPIDEHSELLAHAVESSAWSGDSGLAELVDDVRRSRYVVAVDDERFAAPPILVDASAGGVDTKIVVHSAVKIAVDFDPLPEVGSLARVCTSEGVEVHTKIVPASGRMSFALAPGGYRLDLVENGGTIAGVPFTVVDQSFVLEIGR
jgi:hypothetical protein